MYSGFLHLRYPFEQSFTSTERNRYKIRDLCVQDSVTPSKIKRPDLEIDCQNCFEYGDIFNHYWKKDFPDIYVNVLKAIFMY